MSRESADPRAADLFASLRALRDAQLELWAKLAVDIVNSEVVVDAAATALSAYLTASAPVREALKRTLPRVLAELHMPSRAEVIGLAERMTHMELRLDDLDAKLDAILRNTPPAAPAAGADANATPIVEA